MALGASILGCRADRIETYAVPKAAGMTPAPAAGMGSGAGLSGELPPGHPPMTAGAESLPPGHPPLTSGAESLPPGHPPLDSAPAAPAGDAGSGHREVDWTVPAGWVEQPPSSMRVGSFLIKGTNGQQADMSVVPLSGSAGGDLANINRWRGQIGLGPLSEADLTAQSQTVMTGGNKFLFINFVSQERLIDGRHKRRLMAAIHHHGDRTWFFKMVGEDATVSSAKPAFLDFLKSLRFHEH